MVKIFLSINMGKDIIILPVTPEQYDIEKKWNVQEVDGLYQSMTIAQNQGISKIKIDSFFPVRDYPFLADKTMKGMQYVKKIEEWISLRVPIRLIISLKNKKKINMLTIVDGFTYGAGKDGDINYSLSFVEFPLVRIR